MLQPKTHRHAHFSDLYPHHNFRLPSQHPRILYSIIENML